MTPFPLHSGSSADCGRVVAALREANFREATICGALKLGDLSDLGTANSQNTDLRGLAPGLGFCIRLFLFFEPVARAALELALGREVVGSLVALGILEPADEKGWRLRAAVFFYPVTGWYVASDSVVGPDRGPVVPFDDWLLPAIFEETLRFVRLLPAGPVAEALDLGTGTGIAALVLARTAGRVAAVEISARAVEYARWNCALNGAGNVEVLSGDLYGPVAGRTFDAIVAHPPYMPVAGEALAYRDAGETGEEVGRRIVEGLPAHLRRGGEALILMRGFETAEASFEARARGWLGAAAGEFAVEFERVREEPLAEALADFAERRELDAAGRVRVEELFARVGATNFAYGALWVRRS